MKAALIADDLTGANNVGVMLAKEKLATVTVSYERPSFPSRCEVVTVDTDSRYLPADEARARVAAAGQWAIGQGAQILCNRVDNLLRGNIGAETEGILQSAGANALAIVAPAFPVLGRCIVDGQLMVNGEPVHTNPVAANDPFAPVTQSYIPALIGEQFNSEVARAALKDVEAGASHLADRFRAMAGSGTRVAVVDAQTDAHVATIAAAMAMLDHNLIPVDPGPLSAQYLKACKTAAHEARRSSKVILALGSVTPISLAQFRSLVSKRGIEPVWLDPDAVLGSEAERADAIASAVEEGLARLPDTTVLAVTTRHIDHAPLDLDERARKSGLTPHALSKKISDALAVATMAIIERADGTIGGCFPSGGDVTASLFKCAETEAIEVYGDVIPLTAHVAFSGGRLDGLRLVTKGGSIGDEDAMETCLDFLIQKLNAG